MNLVDFVVIEIIEEKHGLLYELLDMTEGEALEDGAKWLFHVGCSQSCRTRDMGGERLELFIHDISTGNRPYKVGDKGVH